MPFDGINYGGKNFAPVKPLQEAKTVIRSDEKNSSSIAAFAREMWQGLSTENEPAWREVIEQGRVIAIMRAGKLVIKRDLAGTGYVYLKPLPSTSGGRDRSNYPLFPQCSETLKSKWVQSRIRVEPRTFGDDPTHGIRLKDASLVVASYFRDIFTSLYELREALSAQDYGTYITQFEYDDKLNQMTAIAPIVQNKSKVMVPGYGACYDCGTEGHPDDFAKTGAPMPQCPECNSFRTTDMVPDAIADSAEVTDIQEIVQGDIRGSLRDFPACRYDLRGLPHESDWFLYSETVPLRMTRQMFGEDLDIAEADADDIGFQVMDALAARGGNIENLGENNHYGTRDRFTEEGYLRNMYLKPAQYAGFKISEAEQTLAGRIPANVPFEEIFPDGLCFRGFNDMRLITGIHAKKVQIASGVMFLQSHSGHGKGVSDAVDAAKDLNQIHSMAMAGLQRYGAGGIAIDKDSGLTQEDVRNLFKPGKAVFVDTTNNGGDINRTIRQVQPNPVNPVLPQYAIQISNMLNMAFMTSDFTQGAVQDVDINTFGGQQLAHAKAEEAKGAIITMKMSHREQAAEILWELFTKHIQMPRWYAHSNQKHGTTKGKWIAGVDMPKALKFDSVPGSEHPETMFEKRMNAQTMIKEGGGLLPFMQAAQADPHLTAWYTGLYGVQLPNMDEEEIQIVCEARLANIQELSNLLPDPQQILLSLDNKLYVREDAHLLKAQFLGQIIDDDQVLGWNPVAKATVEALIEQHYELEAEAQLRNEQIKMRAQQQLAAEQQNFNNQMMAPQIAQQQAMQQQQQQADAQGQQEAQMGAVAQDIAGRLMDSAQKQDDQTQQEATADVAHERSETAAQSAHERQMEMERHKAALTPAKPAPKGSAAKRK